MPPPAEFQLTPEPFPLRREFVVFPRRLYRGGWAWGTIYHRRVERGEKINPVMTRWSVKDEYFTEEQAIMTRLEGVE